MTMAMDWNRPFRGPYDPPAEERVLPRGLASSSSLSSQGSGGGGKIRGGFRHGFRGSRAASSPSLNPALRMRKRPSGGRLLDVDERRDEGSKLAPLLRLRAGCSSMPAVRDAAGRSRGRSRDGARDVDADADSKMNEDWGWGELAPPRENLLATQLTPRREVSAKKNPFAGAPAVAAETQARIAKAAVVTPAIVAVPPVLVPPALEPDEDRTPSEAHGHRDRSAMDTVQINNMLRGAPPATFSESCHVEYSGSPQFRSHEAVLNPPSLVLDDGSLAAVSYGAVRMDAASKTTTITSQEEEDCSGDLSETASEESAQAADGQPRSWSTYLSPTTLLGSCSSLLGAAVQRTSSSLLSPPVVEVDAVRRGPRQVRFSIVDDVVPRGTAHPGDDDARGNWRKLDVPRALRNIEAISRRRGIAVSAAPAAAVVGRTCMVHIEPKALADEIRRKTEQHRRAVLDEQERQREEGGPVDVEALGRVAGTHSQWGVELASSHWWLER